MREPFSNCAATYEFLRFHASVLIHEFRAPWAVDVPRRHDGMQSDGQIGAQLRETQGN